MNLQTKRTEFRISAIAAWLLLTGAAGCSFQPADAGVGSSAQSISCLVCGANADLGTGTVGQPPPPPPPSGGTFTVHALGNMCLDFGGQAYWAPGAPVTLYWCNGSIAQEFDVQEVAGAGHDVTLHLGTGTDNNYCIGARGGKAVAGAALEIQVCNGSAAQQFALDGDSIIAGHLPGIVFQGGLARSFLPITSPPQPIVRELVARPLDGVTNAKTPIVLGPRQLTQDEYLTFVPTDKSNRKPHSGFVTPVPLTGQNLQMTLQGATWGTVVDLPYSTIDMTGYLDTPIHDGVTLRGDRWTTGYGPLIEYNNNDDGPIFELGTDTVPGGHSARITGLRFQGATWGTDQPVKLTAIKVHDDGDTTVIIDHNELYDFTSNGIEVHGKLVDHIGSCGLVTFPSLPRATPVRISENFIHHVIGDGQGYGVVAGYGGFPLVERNTAYQNRHTVAASPDALSGYVATDNFILHQAPIYNGYDHTSNFDVHGDGSALCRDHWGGDAGDYVVIQYNTVLSNDRQNVLIRGQSCRPGLVDGNIFGEGKDVTEVSVPVPFTCSPRLILDGGAVVNLKVNGYVDPAPPDLNVTANNAYGQAPPVDQIAVGDFDGNGIDDIFITTGTGWFYSPGGKNEWRWLRRASEQVGMLRLGDLDGDGRTDVIRANGSELLVSWGGVSDWQTLTQTPARLPITSYAIGNFDGDRMHGDDIFVTDGARWYVAKNGHNFTQTQTSSVPASAMRFGDFDGDGKTDVFAVVGGHWSFSSDAVGAWQALPGAPGDSDNLIAADFDGDGRTDIGRYYIDGFIDTHTPIWKFAYSPSARAPFTGERVTDSPAAWGGHFVDGPGVIWWDADDEFTLGSGTAANAKLSRQKMK
ncbi:MAG TPA: VCBS repeat-containing protein [Polyangia bacterium]|nr:VCBS repeat-containing protein [Polyangia bacterium]